MAADPLGAHFTELWIGLGNLDLGKVVVAGGYGLYLKEQWLRAHRDVRTLIAFDRWPGNTPRATNDFDLILPHEMLRTPRKPRAVIDSQGFAPSLKGKYWKFTKTLETTPLDLDLHALPPDDNDPTLQVKDQRIKHKAISGKDGFHAYIDPEALGFDTHPFQIKMNGLEVLVPNPVTWTTMKLQAAIDRMADFESEHDPDRREYHSEQARKHTLDVCRIAAMTTREESDLLGAVLEIHKTDPVHGKSRDNYVRLFKDSAGGGSRIAAGNGWGQREIEIIRDTLGSWFI